MSLLARLLCLLPLLALGLGCGKKPAEPVAAPEAALAATFGQGTWLRERLPADSIAYLRVPAPWRLLLGPAGKSSDLAYSNQAWTAAVEQIRAQLAADSLLGDQALPAFALLRHVGAPIEIAVVGAGRIASPAVSIFLTTSWNGGDAASLAAMLASLPGATEDLAFDAEGYLQYGADAGKVFLHFDHASRRLSALSGMFATLDGLKALRTEIAGIQPATQPRLALEREVDAAGHGLVLWADMEALRPILGMGVGQMPAALRETVIGARTLALGWGSVDGRGRISLRAEFAASSWTRLLPQHPRKLDLASAGPPRYLLSLALPYGEEWSKLGAALGDEQRRQIDEFEHKLREASGLGYAEWRLSGGPEMVFFGDRHGDFLATRLPDKAQMERGFASLVEKMGGQRESHAVAGGQVHMMELGGFLDLMQRISGEEVPKVDGPAGQWLAIMGRERSRLWWIEQDGWMVFNTVPQPLLDRLRGGTDTRLDTHLRSIGVPQPPLLLLTGQVVHAQQRIYHSYLSLLQIAADYSGTRLDMLSLPTAGQLKFAAEDSIALSLDLAPERLVLEFGYGQSPVEALSGTSGLAAVSVVGILAAVAIPAYQDYRIRAEVSTALVGSAAIKLAATEAYMAKGELPEDSAALGLDLPLEAEDGVVEYDLDNGAIVIRFSDAANDKLAGRYLYLLPADTGAGTLEWVCGSAGDSRDDLLVSMDGEYPATDIEERYLPASCL